VNASCTAPERKWAIRKEGKGWLMKSRYGRWIVPGESRSRQVGLHSSISRVGRVLQRGVPRATNNRMEMTAAIEGLRALRRPYQVRVLTDS
jgi:hypothetical protein